MTRGQRQKSHLSQGRLYEVIRRPVITEKATLNQEHNQVTFEVALDANKGEVKEAVQRLFNVTVTKVNTLRQKGKEVRWRGRPGQRGDRKKAIVTLKEGDSIDVTTGI